MPVLAGPARTTFEARTHQTIAVLVLPLAENGYDVSMLFGAFERVSSSFGETQAASPLETPARGHAGGTC